MFNNVLNVLKCTTLCMVTHPICLLKRSSDSLIIFEVKISANQNSVHLTLTQQFCPSMNDKLLLSDPFSSSGTSGFVVVK